MHLRRYTKASTATDQGATGGASGAVRATGSGAGWLTQFALLLTRAHKSQRRDVVGVVGAARNMLKTIAA